MKKIVLTALSIIFLLVIGLAGFYFSKNNNFQIALQKMESFVRQNPQISLWLDKLQNRPQPLAGQVIIGQFKNGQNYKIFTSDDFEMKYPVWPNIDLTKITNSENIKIAVTNQECTFILKISPLPQGIDFKTQVQKTFDNSASSQVGTLANEIGENKAYFEGEINLGNIIKKNISYVYLTKKNNTAGFALSANRDFFGQSCQPIIDEIVVSVKLK